MFLNLKNILIIKKNQKTIKIIRLNRLKTTKGVFDKGWS